MPSSGNMPISGASFQTAIPLHNRIAAAPISQYLTRMMSSRRQRIMGPISKASINSTMMGTVALLKYGGPTEILSPIASAASGYSVPIKTTARMTLRKILFATIPPSRLIS